METHRAALLAGLLVSGMVLAGCKPSGAPDVQPSGTASENAGALGPDAKPGVTVGAARLVLPVVPGRPGVAYFRITNTAVGPITLAGVHIAGVGRAEMHRTTGGKMARVDKVDTAPGAALAFAPGGYHVMAFNISDTLKVGDETEITLTFADGDKVSAPAKVAAMGADAGGMSH